MPDRPFIDALTKGRPIANVLAHAVIDKVTALPSNTLTAAQAPQVAKDTAAIIAADPKIALVPVKSGWRSKINWTAAGAIAGAVGIYFFPGFTLQQKVDALTGIAGIAGTLIILFKQFGTGSISPQSKG